MAPIEVIRTAEAAISLAHFAGQLRLAENMSTVISIAVLRASAASTVTIVNRITDSSVRETWRKKARPSAILPIATCIRKFRWVLKRTFQPDKAKAKLSLWDFKKVGSLGFAIAVL